MEENKNSMFKTSLNYGAIYGGIIVIYSIIMYLLNISTQKWTQWLMYPIMIAALAWLLIKFRNEHCGGFISYGKAVLMGLLISLFAAIISAFYTFVLMKFIDPNITAQIISQAEQNMVESGMQDDQIAMAMTMVEKFTNPTFIAITSIFSLTLVGLLLSIFIAIFVKKKDNDLTNI